MKDDDLDTFHSPLNLVISIVPVPFIRVFTESMATTGTTAPAMAFIPHFLIFVHLRERVMAMTLVMRPVWKHRSPSERDLMTATREMSVVAGERTMVASPEHATMVCTIGHMNSWESVVMAVACAPSFLMNLIALLLSLHAIAIVSAHFLLWIFRVYDQLSVLMLRC